VIGPTGLPRLIATDLDGTLARPDGLISARSARALAAATAAGSLVVLVTGRPVRWLARIYPCLVEPYPAVCANGAVIYEPALDAVLESRTIPLDTVRSAFERIRAAVPGVAFATEVDDSRRMLFESHYPLRREAPGDGLRAATFDELCSTPAVKLLVRVDGWDPDALAAAVRDAVGRDLEATHSAPYGLVELSARSVTKATGLAAYASSVGLGPDDAIVFGDMPNDLPMFAWAAGGAHRRTIAVANAHDAVLAAASAVIGSNVDDGVAAYLEDLLG
jgi:hypothetical protein